LNDCRLRFGNDLNIITDNDKNKRIKSFNHKNNPLNKRKRNSYNFNENTFSYNDKDNKKIVEDKKRQSLRINTINSKNKENKLSNDLIEDFLFLKKIKNWL